MAESLLTSTTWLPRSTYMMRSARKERRVIAVDIGGTSARFGAFRLDENDGLHREASTWVESGRATRFSDLYRLVAEGNALPFLPGEADYVAVAAAGPVRLRRYCKLTNLPWEIDIVESSREAGIARAAIMNDLVAQAFATQTSIGRGAVEVCAGQPIPGGAIAVIAPGTGLGKAALVSDSSGRSVAVPSEGGHAQFVPENEDELRFARFVAERSGLIHATWEEVLSGHGLSTLACFLLGEELRPEQVAARFSSAPQLLDWASRFLARGCRNFALEVLSTGRVFLAGGVAAKNPVLTQNPAFEREFRASARHQDLLAQMPVRLVSDQESGLWGAAFFAVQELGVEHGAPVTA